MTKPLVIIESKYAAGGGRTIDQHVLYARRALRDSLDRGEAPIASHLLYTQPGVLNDGIPGERSLGIEAGLAWSQVADLTAFYVDYGWSKGMVAAYHRAREEGREYEMRYFFPGGEKWVLYMLTQNEHQS